MDKIMNYLVFLCFLYLLYISYHKNKSIFNPSNFFITFWFVNYFILMFFIRDFYLYYAGSAFILLASGIVYVGGNIGMNIKLTKDKTFVKFSDFIYRLKYLSLYLSIIGLLVVPLMIYNVNGDIIKFFNIGYIRMLSRYVSYIRYALNYNFPFYIQILLGINYFASLINGIYFAYIYLNKKMKYFFIYIIPIITSVLISLVTTEKAVIIYTLLLFITSFFVSYNSLNNEEFKISFKKMMMFINIFILIFMIFIFIQMSRYGMSGIDGIKYVVSVFKIYAFGHISAFSIWFTKYLMYMAPLGCGRYTFAGIFSLLNISEREPGIFIDYSVISQKPLMTNIYTAFRGLIVDFSLLGAILVMFFFSLLAGIAYANYKRSYLSFIYLILFYSITLLSFITSLLNYNTLIGAFGLLGLTMGYYNLRSHRR